MKISSTAVVHKAIRKDGATISEMVRDRQIELPVGVAHDTPDNEIEPYSMEVARSGKVEAIQLSIQFDTSDPADMQTAAKRLEAIASELNGRAAALKPKEPKPSIDFMRTGTGATIGAVGGYSAGLLLQELGKAGTATGNPFISTVAIACTIGGTALGAGIGSGILTGEVTKFGIKLSANPAKAS